MNNVDVDLMDLQVRNVLNLREKGGKDELKKYIIPYLYEGSLFPNSREEFRLEMQGIVSKAELDALCEQERPDVFEAEWNGFRLAYMLDWGMAQHDIVNPDFVTKQMVSRNRMDHAWMQEVAVKNLDYLKAGYLDLTHADYNNLELGIYMIQYDRTTVPPYESNILMNKTVLKRLFREIGEAYFIFPFYKDALYTIRKTEARRGEFDIF